VRTDQLPKGRHGLTREQVADSQRTRLLRATVELVTERGFGQVTLSDLVGRAGVARSTFYEYFADKQQCFLEAYDYASDRVIEYVLADGPPSPGEFATPVHAYVARLLALCIEEPTLVRLVAADAGGLGPAAAMRQRAARERLADCLVAARAFDVRDEPSLAPISHLRAVAIVGAITEVLQHTLSESGPDALPALRPELTRISLALLEAPPV
jgi:AcrR family transcriptional regulator